MKSARSLILKKDQIWILIAKDFKLKYNFTALGFAWSLLVPVFSSMIYYFVFGIMLRWNTDNFLLYLLSGTFLWQFFSNVVIMNGNVLMANSGLLKKTAFDRRLLIWGTFFAESVHLILTIPILVVLMLFYKVTPDFLTVLPNIAVCLIILAFFSIGLSYAYAAANIYFHDLERIMNIFMQMWMFMTPIFIPASAIPEKYSWIYVVNPLAGIVTVWRDAFYKPDIHVELWGNLALISIAVFFFGRWIFMRLESRFAEMV